MRRTQKFIQRSPEQAKGGGGKRPKCETVLRGGWLSERNLKIDRV
jgi:hypothetical protein